MWKTHHLYAQGLPQMPQTPLLRSTCSWIFPKPVPEQTKSWNNLARWRYIRQNLPMSIPNTNEFSVFSCTLCQKQAIGSFLFCFSQFYHTWILLLFTPQMTQLPPQICSCLFRDCSSRSRNSTWAVEPIREHTQLLLRKYWLRWSIGWQRSIGILD